MDLDLTENGSPGEAIIRVGSHHGPCEPPPWSRATSDLTFGHRFDDPRAAQGRPLADCFRSVYFGSTAEAAFGEVLAGFQPPLAYLANLAAVDDDDSLDAILAGILERNPRTGRVRGIVPAEWRATRRLCSITLDPELRFADLTTIHSRMYLRRAMAPLASQLGIRDLDFSTLCWMRASAVSRKGAPHTFTKLPKHRACPALPASTTCPG